jgi:TolB-like protein
MVLLLLCSQYLFAYEKEIKGISSTITESIAKSGKKTMAVVDFTDLQGNVTELGRFIAEELSVDLTTSARGLEVIDRTYLKSLLKEHKLSMSGLVDPNTVKKLGQIAGVDAIITGSVTPFGDSIRISCKVIVTDTARVIGAAKGDIAKTKAIEELLARGIETVQSSVSTTSYIPSSQSKKVGDITVTVKRITVAKGRVTALLDFLNHSDKNLRLHTINYGTSLTDEKGNTISDYSGGSVTLNRNSSNDVVLYFRYRTDDINIGSIFTFALKFELQADYKILSTHDITFTDIKAQMPK